MTAAVVMPYLIFIKSFRLSSTCLHQAVDKYHFQRTARRTQLYVRKFDPGSETTILRLLDTMPVLIDRDFQRVITGLLLALSELMCSLCQR